MEDNNGPNFSDAIAEFLERERIEAERREQEAAQRRNAETGPQDPPSRQQTQQPQDPDHTQESRPTPNPRPQPRHEPPQTESTPPPRQEHTHSQQENVDSQQQPTQITFVFENEEMQLHENDATPTAIAEYFELDRNEIQLTRNNRIFNIHPTEDRFKPNVKAGKKYTVTRTQPTPPPRHRQEQNNGSECTLIANNQKKKVSAGTIKRSAIVNTFALGKQIYDIKLIEEDGTVHKSQQQYILRADATYHVVYNDQDELENDNDDEHDDANEIFFKPLSLMSPFMVAAVRWLYALSFTGDSVAFTANTEPKSTSSSKLLCANKLSTCAYQVTYRFNTALQTIQKLVGCVRPSNREEEQPLGLFDDPKDCEDFCGALLKVEKLLEKAHGELEELINLVLTEMRTTNPSIESVQISLKVEENQEKRAHERETQKNNDREQLTEKCDKIFKKEEQEIHPLIIDLDKISSNRKVLTTPTKLVEKILHDLNSTISLEDITNLLNFCAKISHCNLMHWIFVHNLFQHLGKDFDVAARNTVEYRRKIDVTKKVYHALRFWEIVSHGISLPMNLNEKAENVQTHWDELKDSIITSQYALEICYFEQD